MKNEIITENKQAGRSVGEGSLRKLFRALFAEATNWAIITPTVKFIRSLRYAQRSLLHNFREAGNFIVSLNDSLASDPELFCSLGILIDT